MVNNFARVYKFRSIQMFRHYLVTMNPIIGVRSWWSQSSIEIQVLTLVVTVLGALWWVLLKISSRSPNPPLPPGPRGLPLLGYLPFLGTHLHRAFTDLASTYGPIYKLWLGNKLCVIISSPSLFKQVVRDHDVVFSNRDPPISALVLTYGASDIAFSDNGPHWRKMRKVFVREMLSASNLDACYHLRKQEVRDILRHVYSKSGTPVEVGKLTFLTVSKAVMSMLVGGSGETGGVSIADVRETAADIMVLFGEPNVSDLFPILARFDLQGIEKRSKVALLRVEKLVDSMIEQRSNSRSDRKSSRKDFLQVLLELRESEDSEISITLTQLKALLMDIVIGGNDTTSSTAEWVIAELIKNPTAMTQVQQELTQVVGEDNLVEESHLPELRYLHAVIKETLRLHPALPLLVPRCPNQTTVVGGYTVPAKTRVFLNVWAIHRDPLIWDSPLEFRPQRFLVDPLSFDFSGNNFGYVPFGSGRRVCPGQSLADRLLPFILASFLHSFEWKLLEGQEIDLSDKFGIVIKKLKPLVAVPTPRLSNLDLYL